MRKLDNLQCVRAVAALLVVIAHAIIRIDEWAHLRQFSLALATGLGALGVHCFFVLSGFIMMYTSRNAFGVRGSSANFVVRRLVRIVPMYWLATASEVVVRLVRDRNLDLDRVVKSFLFIPYVGDPGQPLRPLLGVGWSLNYEMWFYALFALAIFLPRRFGALTLCLALFGIVGVGNVFKPVTDTAQATTVIEFLTDPIVLLFGAGVCLGAIGSATSNPFTRIMRPFMWSGAIVLFCGIVFASTGIGFPAPFGFEWAGRALAVLIVAMCTFGATTHHRWLSPALELAGDASYCIYLFHFLIIVATEKLWLSAVGERSPALAIAAVSVVSFVIGITVHLAVEKPILRMLRRFVLVSPREASQNVGGLVRAPGAHSE